MLLTSTFRVVLLSAALAAPGFARSAAATVDAQCTVTTFVLMEAPPAPPPVAGRRAGGARPPAAAR